MNKFALGFTSLSQEYELNELAVRGNIPDWLNGNYVVVGPAQYEFGIKHWFDGLAMLYSFKMAAGHCSFNNRFLQTEQFCLSKRQNQLALDEFATAAKRSLLSRGWETLSRLTGKVNGVSDNTNVNTIKLAEHYYALTEIPTQLEFDPDSLDTLAKAEYPLQSMLVTAHPHYDSVRNEWLNVSLKLGIKPTYQISAIDNITQQLRIIANYQPKKPFYLHSFSVTPNYIILANLPLKISITKLLASYPFNEALVWDRQNTAEFVVVDRRSGKVTSIPAQGFMCLHTVNAYELGAELVVDLVRYIEVGNPYDYFYLANLLADNFNVPATRLERYVLNLTTKTAACEILSQHNLEFPRIDYLSCNGNNYRYVYAAYKRQESSQDFLNGLVKIDVASGQSCCWFEEGCYVDEPIFVPKRPYQSEDGVVLALVMSSQAKASFLLITDNNLQELARVYLPLVIPFALHGNFYT